MSTRVALVVFALGIILGWHFLRSGAPSARQVEPLLRSYLTEARNCRGTLVITQLDSVSVGPYVEQMGGWPVFANHVEECHESGTSTPGSLTSTYDGSNDAEHRVAAAFARRTASGRVELFVPEFFQAGMRDMQEKLQKQLDNVTIKVN